MQEKITSFCCQSLSKPKSWKFFFFLMNEQKFETFVFFSINLNIVKVGLLTQHFPKIFTTKSRWQVVKGW